MNIENIQQLVMATLEDHKARDITDLDVSELTSVTDRMIICSASSKRHVKTLADRLIVNAKANGITPLGVEGTDIGEWVLVDLNEIVVHIMLPEVREFYSLEKLWTTTEQARSQYEDDA